jgi:hypothetical protein
VPRPWPIATAALLVLAAPARAQFGEGGATQPETPLDPRTRIAAVESLAVQAERRYIFPERGAELARVLRRQLKARAYDGITGHRALADTLTAQMQHITHDGHMRVMYRLEPFPADPTDDGPPPAEELELQRREARLRNHGFEQVRRMAGNIGYLDLRAFSGFAEAHETLHAAMRLLAHTDALIVDLRRNGGGDPEMVQALVTYFVREGERLHINDFERREGRPLEQFHSLAHVPGPRFAGRPLMVLTSGLTGSAAEEFAYDVQTHRLGTVLGATTYGAANPGGAYRLTEHLAAFIATGRAVNPVTRTNWEGVGVKPDVAVPAHEALREAHVRLLTQLREQATDLRRQALLDRALQAARETPHDREEAFRVPGRS